MKMAGRMPNERYRVRQGLYRIGYEIRDEELVIHVVKAAHRSNVYRNNEQSAVVESRAGYTVTVIFQRHL